MARKYQKSKIVFIRNKPLNSNLNVINIIDVACRGYGLLRLFDNKFYPSYSKKSYWHFHNTLWISFSSSASFNYPLPYLSGTCYHLSHLLYISFFHNIIFSVPLVADCILFHHIFSSYTFIPYTSLTFLFAIFYNSFYRLTR